MAKLSRAALRSAMWHALLAHGKREADRDQLADGSCIALEMHVEASSGAAMIMEDVIGDLTVGHGQTQASSTQADIAKLVAYFLEQVPKAKRIHLLDTTPEFFEKTGELPSAGAETIDAVKRMLGRLRHRTSVDRRGAVSFRPQVAAEAV